jgi:hypothetical protein
MSYNDTSIRDARVLTITPDMAKAMLERNANNRVIKPTIVKAYSEDIMNDAWKTTHQGIAFNSSGELVDGQHRLSAIVMANKPVNMLVCTYNENFGAINSPLDLQVKRSLSDTLGKDSFHMAAIAYIMKTLSKKCWGRVESNTILFLDALGDKYEWMHHHLSTKNSRLFSVAPIRAACFVAYLAGKDWSPQYNNLAGNNIQELDGNTYMLYKKLYPYTGCSNTHMFRAIAFNASFAVAMKMVDDRSRFSSQLLEKARVKAQEVLEPYFVKIK